MSDETEVIEEEKFASTEAIKFAEECGLTAAKIEELGVEPTSKEGTFTKTDVKKAAELFKGDDPEPAEETEKEELEGDVFTYVGGGEDSPRKINFMGRQEFIRGRATQVTDPIVLAKVKVNQCFTEGEVDPEDLHDYDEEERAKAAAQRKEDAEVDAAFKKRHG